MEDLSLGRNAFLLSAATALLKAYDANENLSESVGVLRGAVVQYDKPAIDVRVGQVWVSEDGRTQRMITKLTGKRGIAYIYPESATPRVCYLSDWIIWVRAKNAAVKEVV